MLKGNEAKEAYDLINDVRALQFKVFSSNSPVERTAGMFEQGEFAVEEQGVLIRLRVKEKRLKRE